MCSAWGGLKGWAQCARSPTLAPSGRTLYFAAKRTGFPDSSHSSCLTRPTHQHMACRNPPNSGTYGSNLLNTLRVFQRGRRGRPSSSARKSQTRARRRSSTPGRHRRPLWHGRRGRSRTTALAGCRSVSRKLLLCVGLKAQCALDVEAKSAPTGLLDADRGFAFVQTAFEQDEAAFEVVTETR